VTLEFDPKEVRDLKDLGSSPFMPEQEIKEVYDRVIRRAAASLEKPDSLFMLQFIRRSSFMRKSSHREKLLTLLGALQSSVPWSGKPYRTTVSNGPAVRRFDHRGRPVQS